MGEKGRKETKSMSKKEIIHKTIERCPFCGAKMIIDSTDTLREILGETIYVPRCENRECIAYHLAAVFENKDDAAIAWNRRVLKGGGSEEQRNHI